MLLNLAFTGIFIMGSSSNKEVVYDEDVQNNFNSYALNLPSEIDFCGEKVPLDEVDVREKLDRELLINSYSESNSLLMTKRANRYFPVIRPILKSQGIPDDFKYLALIESGLQDVISPSGAEGFWQFLKETGKQFGLEISAEVDERYNVVEATKAACIYFKQAYKKFNNWTLAAASYNMGMLGVQTQIDKQKVPTYYDLYLNVETGRYLYRLLSVKEILSHPEKYGLRYQERHLYYPIPTKQIVVNKPIASWNDWALEQGINLKILKLLNSWIKGDKLTNVAGKSYFVDIPVSKNLSVTNAELKALSGTEMPIPFETGSNMNEKQIPQREETN